MSTLVVVAKIKAKPEAAGQVRQELMKLIEPTRTKDAGCIRYELHQDTTDPSVFVFLEEWQSAELLDAHIQSAHLQACLKAIDGLAELFEVNRLDKIA